jgi:hypothetical protein
MIYVFKIVNNKDEVIYSRDLLSYVELLSEIKNWKRNDKNGCLSIDKHELVPVCTNMNENDFA